MLRGKLGTWGEELQGERCRDKALMQRGDVVRTVIAAESWAVEHRCGLRPQLLAKGIEGFVVQLAGGFQFQDYRPSLDCAADHYAIVDFEYIHVPGFEPKLFMVNLDHLQKVRPDTATATWWQERFPYGS